MLKQNRKGISLVALTVSIFIILVLLSVSTVSIIGNYNKSKKIQFATELNMVQMAVNSYYSSNSKYPVVQSFKVSGAAVNANSEQFSGEIYENGGYIFNTIDYDAINLKSLRYGSGKAGISDTYVVSQRTGKVYYAAGLKIGGKYYFTVNDELNSFLGANSGEIDTVVEDGIVFLENIIDSQQKEVTIKIPKKYTVSSVMAENTRISLESSDSNYNIYKNTSDQVYTLVIDYKNEQGVSKNVKHTVNKVNVDETALNSDNQYSITYLKGDQLFLGDEIVMSGSDSRASYSLNKGVFNVTAKLDDGYILVPRWVYLEAGKEYYFSCDTDGGWGLSDVDSVEAFLMLNGEYRTYYHLPKQNYYFTPTTTGPYQLRLDVNKQGKTYTFSNICMYEVVRRDIKTYNEFLSDIPVYSRSTGQNLVKPYSNSNQITTHYANYNFQNNKLSITSTSNDGYVTGIFNVNLEANKKYKIKFSTDAFRYHISANTDSIQIYLLLNGGYSKYYEPNNIISTLVPDVSGNYYLRFDVNASGKTYSFYDVEIRELKDSKVWYTQPGIGNGNEITENTRVTKNAIYYTH